MSQSEPIMHECYLIPSQSDDNFSLNYYDLAAKIRFKPINMEAIPFPLDLPRFFKFTLPDEPNKDEFGCHCSSGAE